KRHRSAKRSSCSMISRRRLRFCDLSRNSMAAQRTRLKRMRLMRWMMIGRLSRALPARRYPGFKNDSNMHARLGRDFQSRAMMQELSQDSVQGVIGLHERVVDSLPRATAADLNQVFLQSFEIAVAQRPRIAKQLRQLFHPLETRRAGKGKAHLVFI